MEASHIDFVHEKRHMDDGGLGGGGLASVTFLCEKFRCFLKMFNILELSIQSIHNPAFS